MVPKSKAKKVASGLTRRNQSVGWLGSPLEDPGESLLFHVVGKICFHVVVGLSFPLPCWLPAGDWPQLLGAAYIPWLRLQSQE